jgi:hypothetical protein
MAALNPNLRNFYIQWPNNATLTLIQRRRVHQHLFTSTQLTFKKGYGVELRGKLIMFIPILRQQGRSVEPNGTR